MNIIKENNRILRFESYWRNSRNSKLRDSNNKLFPYPKERQRWSGKHVFLDRYLHVVEYLKENDRYITKDSKDCLLCDDRNITKGDLNMNNVIWEDGLYHYIKKHNIKPTEEFIDMIYNFEYDDDKKEILRIDGILYEINDLKYLRIDTNQIMIMDALMVHGGYGKKYVDKNNRTIYRYSEHAGLIDFNDKTIEKIIISGKTSRVDEGDEEIYLPKNIPEALDYEYIFHTHPPTPKPGGRVNIGILYEFPSISDIFHFIDHYNDGKTQGSIVIAPEGLYNIRTLKLDNKKIKINEDQLFNRLSRLLVNLQTDAINKYGTRFSTYVFYSKISQDTSYIKKINSLINQYNLQIDFYPRERDSRGNWIINTIYLPIYVINPI